MPCVHVQSCCVGAQSLLAGNEYRACDDPKKSTEVALAFGIIISLLAMVLLFIRGVRMPCLWKLNDQPKCVRYALRLGCRLASQS